MDVRGVIRNDQRIFGRTSDHQPFADSSHFFRLFKMALFDASACPLACGYLGEENVSFMPYKEQKSFTAYKAN